MVTKMKSCPRMDNLKLVHAYTIVEFTFTACVKVLAN